MFEKFGRIHFSQICVKLEKSCSVGSEVAPTFDYPMVKVMYQFRRKMGWATMWAIFFSPPFGQPASDVFNYLIS
jgi:hypothetical protein